jgi:protein TonB
MPVANSAPDVAPPSPPTQSAGKDSWEARVVACLESLKRFPPAARSRRDQGVATVRFRVNRHGTLLSLSLEASSGNRLLDQEALATVARAEPYPPIPAGRPDEIEVVVPIEFFLGSRRSH